MIESMRTEGQVSTLSKRQSPVKSASVQATEKNSQREHLSWKPPKSAFAHLDETVPRMPAL